MNTAETYNSYGVDNFKFKLYESLQERNNLFGYNYVVDQPTQRAHYDSYFVNGKPGRCQDIRSAPKDYYFDMRVDDAQKTILGPMNTRPNIYNDIVVPYKTTFEVPNTYKSWQPFTTTAMGIPKGQAVQFIPHAPVEVAPNNDSRYWVADQNAELYERKLITSAREQPYANWYRRQGLIGLMALNMRPDGDYYTKKIDSPADAFSQMTNPPATTSF